MKARIAVLPGDGIGVEVLREARKVLEEIGREFHHEFETVEGDIGAAAITRHGEALPERTREICISAQAVLLGAVGLPTSDNPDSPPRPETGLLELRSLLGNYANLRPVTVKESLIDSSPLRPERIRGVDLLIVRELLGGIYFGLPRGIKNGAAYNTEVYSEEQVRRVARIAFTLAGKRRKKVVSVDKANVLETSILWRRVCEIVSLEFPDVGFESIYVDNCAMQLVSDPRKFDVILTNNLFGDILSDEAAVLEGSLGMLPSASIGGVVGLYEPVHGSAPDIAGRQIANPIGAILSVAMMLEHSFYLTTEAVSIQRAVVRTLEQGYRTADLKPDPSKKELGRPVSTSEMGALVCESLKMPDPV